MAVGIAIGVLVACVIFAAGAIVAVLVYSPGREVSGSPPPLNQALHVFSKREPKRRRPKIQDDIRAVEIEAKET